MNVIERSRCVLSDQADLAHLHTFKDFPVFMGCMDQPPEADLKADMSWWISRSSGLVQLKQLLPLDVLYPESHGAGAVGALWERHHRSFAQFVNKLAPRAVFEIGGAHGILEREYQVLGAVPWTIIEPNPSPVEGCQARFIKGFFDDKFVFDSPFDVVVHSHVFEHIYEPERFMSHLAGFMPDGKSLVFSLPNMQVMMERKYTNCINFEHTVLLTEPYVEHLLAKHGFRLQAKEYFMDDHSIFYAAVRDSSVKAQALPAELYQRNKQLYADYLTYHDELITQLNGAMCETNSPIYLFGAHVFAQYLLAFGLDTSNIICLLDNDKSKQGRRLYGTNLFVKSPVCLRDVANPYVILKAGVYNDEIKADILNNINSNVRFLE
ncbi:MAG: class I SAM-dependent methyltransferase [Burkholderiales bacterium]|nr:class I SAM-dependent methyltransferase [Burkholderiales bacterium]